MPSIQVPINNTLPWTQAVATAGQTVFSTNWTADVATDVVVYSRTTGVDPDDNTQLVPSTDYNVAFIGSNEYIQVTFNVARAADDIVTVMRNTPADRLNLYINTNFTPTMLNGDFGRQVMMIQQRVLCDNALSVKYNNSATLNPNQITDNILPYLPPGYGWMKNLANTRIVAALFGGGGGGGGNQVIIVVTQPAHGFIADQAVYHNGAEFALALASTIQQAEVVGMVVSVIDANSFNLLVGGQFTTNALVLVPGSVYFISDVTPGLITTVEPVTAGYVSKPVLIATGTDEGVFYNFRGKVINVPTFPWNPVAVNTQMAPSQNYYTTGGGVLDLTLPAIAAAGTEIEIAGIGSLGWRILQNAGQNIELGNVITTVGVGGSVESTDNGDTIRLLCTTANTVWVMLSCVTAGFVVV